MCLSLQILKNSQQIDRNKYKKAVYRVKWGDSLYEIASKVFHDGKRWTIIYDSNKHEIMNIKDLPVGQVLIIPLTIPQSDSFKEICKRIAMNQFRCKIVIITNTVCKSYMILYSETVLQQAK